jgi:coenzyme F420-reducing hydrogenase alpha subunit
MKKHIYIQVIALGLALFAAQGVYAEEAQVNITAQGNIPVNTGTGATIPSEPKDPLYVDKDAPKATVRGGTREVVEVKPGPGVGRSDAKQEAKEEKKEVRQEIQAKYEHIRLVAMIKIVLIRLNATVSRLEKITEKLDARIEKFRKNGADVTAAAAASAEAKTALANAKVKISTIVIPTNNTNASTTRATTKATVKLIEEDLKTAHKAVEKALKSFKGMSVTATSTTTIN